MKENRNKLPTKIVKDHRRKITFLMCNMYPDLEPFEAFRSYEKFQGHHGTFKGWRQQAALFELYF
jgi:hypothetical protein